MTAERVQNSWENFLAGLEGVNGRDIEEVQRRLDDAVAPHGTRRGPDFVLLMFCSLLGNYLADRYPDDEFDQIIAQLEEGGGES